MCRHPSLEWPSLRSNFERESAGSEVERTEAARLVDDGGRSVIDERKIGEDLCKAKTRGWRSC
jgi:hypothetical protein